MSDYTLQCRGVGKYAYQAQADDELSFEEGDPISVWTTDDSGWWYATNERTLEYGFIPESYFEQEEEEEEDAVEEGGVVGSAVQGEAGTGINENQHDSSVHNTDSPSVKDLGAERAAVPPVVKRSRAASLVRQSSAASSASSTSALDGVVGT